MTTTDTLTDTCAMCHEPVEFRDGTWVHPHSADPYCGTGDGAAAWPSDQANLELSRAALTTLRTELPNVYFLGLGTVSHTMRPGHTDLTDCGRRITQEIDRYPTSRGEPGCERCYAASKARRQ